MKSSESTDGEDPADRRRHPRYPVSISVDCEIGDHFLFASIANISRMGIFIRTDEPMPIGTELTIRFGADGQALQLDGQVVWINPLREDGDDINPGMGVKFADLTPEQRERLVEIVRTVAYLQEDATGESGSYELN